MSLKEFRKIWLEIEPLSWAEASGRGGQNLEAVWAKQQEIITLLNKLRGEFDKPRPK